MSSPTNRLSSPNTDWTRAAGSSGPPTPGMKGVITRAQNSQVTSAAMPARTAVTSTSAVSGGNSAAFGMGVASVADMTVLLRDRDSGCGDKRGKGNAGLLWARCATAMAPPRTPGLGHPFRREPDEAVVTLQPAPDREDALERERVAAVGRDCRER